MLWSHTVGARSIYWVHVHSPEWNDAKYIWDNPYIWTAVLLSNYLNWKIYCDDHSLLWSKTAVQIYKLSHIYFTSFHSSRENKLNKLTSLPMVGFIAQLVEHCTGISRRSRVRIPLKPWVFQASSFQLLKLENLLRWSFFTSLIILPWTPKICLECLLCCNQSHVRSSHHRNHKARNSFLSATEQIIFVFLTFSLFTSK